MAKGIVISLYDFTGEALKPWAEDGYECYAYDIQHKGTMEVFPDSGGSIHYEHADLYDQMNHPRWPEYIAPRDAYKKKTCLWTGNDFVMPTKVAVDPEAYHGNGYSTSMMKLGGKSQRTKDIRSATPRGFAIAIHDANKVEKTHEEDWCDDLELRLEEEARLQEHEETYLWTLETAEEFI